jgi:hypothetical protein
MQLSIFRSCWSAFVVLALLVGCGKRPQSPGEPATPQAQDAVPELLYFACPVPRLLASRVSAVNLVARGAGENTSSSSGAFSSFSVLLTWEDGSENEIVLDEPYEFTATDPVHHNGCDNFRFHAVGSLLFFDYSYGIGNPYPAQQVLYLVPAENEFQEVDQLDTSLSDGYLEFGGSDCIETLMKGYGVMQRMCVLESRLTLLVKRLDAQLQENSWHTFLCDLSKEPAVVLEYDFKPSNPEVLEYLPRENQEKMRAACVNFQSSLHHPQSS